MSEKRREIKFRAWIPGIGKYVYNNDMVDDYFISICADGLCVEQLMDLPEPHDGPWTRYVSDATIELSTGLHDKNGREIYEGDKLLSKNSIPIVVKWSFVQLAILSTMSTECIIVGNIHQNPELLGGDSQ